MTLFLDFLKFPSVFLRKLNFVFFLLLCVQLLLENPKLVLQLYFIFGERVELSALGFLDLSKGLVIAVAFGDPPGHFVELLGEFAVGLIEKRVLELDGDVGGLLGHIW